MHTTKRLLGFTLTVITGLMCASIQAQTTVQPRIPKLMPDVSSATPAATPSPANKPQQAAPAQTTAVNNGKLYTFSGRELLAKFTLGGDWVVGDNITTPAGTTTRLVPRGQTVTSYNQRITVQELPTWVNPARLGKEYLKDIMDDCATGTLKALDKGNISQFATDILVLECVDSTAQTVKLVYAALVQGPRAHLVFSKLSLLPLRNPNAAAVAQGELAAFKQLLSALFVCTPNAPKLCQ